MIHLESNPMAPITPSSNRPDHDHAHDDNAPIEPVAPVIVDAWGNPLLLNATVPTGSQMPVQPATDERHQDGDPRGRFAGVDLQPDLDPEDEDDKELGLAARKDKAAAARTAKDKRDDKAATDARDDKAATDARAAADDRAADVRATTPNPAFRPSDEDKNRPGSDAVNPHTGLTGPNVTTGPDTRDCP